MEENANLTEQIADQQDAFLDGWGEEAPDTETANQQEADLGEVSEEAAEKDDAAEADKAAEDAKDEADTEATVEEKTEESPQAVELTWEIKHLGESKTMKASDITPALLQKGMDYDRVHAKYEEAKPIVEMFTEFAKRSNMSVNDYVKYIRAEAKKAEGLSEAEANRAIDLEDREAAVAAREASYKEEADAQASADAKTEADIAEFAKTFPDVYNTAKDKPDTIPKCVWDDVNGGMSLVSAYARYAVAQANERAAEAGKKLEAAALSQKNATRSTGSMKSAGNGERKDAFSSAFDNL